MVTGASLLQLAVWASCVAAFYPYEPEWLKEKEDLKLNAEARREVVTFALEQRTQSRGSTASVASRQAQWLSTKFKHIGRRTRTDSTSVHRRDNQYKVMQSSASEKDMVAGIDQDGTDFSYFVRAKLGSKATELYMLVDTGAGSSWVMGSKCTDKACGMHTLFGAADSTSAKVDSKTFSISYGSGTVRGNLVTDTFSVADITMPYQLGLATETSDDFTHFAFDGILGLSMSQGANDNFLQTLADANKLDHNVFGIYLNRATDGANTGEIMFGAPNKDKYKGDVTYTAVGSKDGDWAIQVDDMSYDGKKSSAGGVLGYIDTGTSFIFGPQSLVKKLHSVIPDASSSDGVTYHVPCDSSKSLTITFSGVDFEMSSKDWISPKDDSGKCTSNIYGHEVVSGAWLLGDTFLKNVYSVFDRDQKRVGFAHLKDSASDSSPVSSSASAASGTSSGSSAQTTMSSPTSTSTGASTDSSATSGGSTAPSVPSLGLGGHESSSTRTSTTSSAAKPTESKEGAASAATPQGALLAAGLFIGYFVIIV